MSKISPAPLIGKEGSVYKKLINKAMAYLMADDDSAGERFELEILIRAASGNIFLDALACTLRRPQDFSRSKFTLTKTFGKLKLPDLRALLPAEMSENSLLTAGGSEVDARLWLDEREENWVLVEAKSGGASMAGKQLHNYIDTMVSQDNHRPGGGADYFSDCHEGKQPPGKRGYLDRFPDILAYLANHRKWGAGSPFARFTTDRVKAQRILAAEVAHLSSVNEQVDFINDTILFPGAQFKLHRFYVEKTTRGKIKSTVLKWIRQVYIDPHALKHDAEFRRWEKLRAVIEEHVPPTSPG